MSRARAPVLESRVMKRILVVSAILVGSIVPARGGSAEAPRYRSPDSDITRVQLGGVWKEGARSGQYRAVVRTNCVNDCYDELFIEWLGPAGGKREVVAAKRVDQVGAQKQILDLQFVARRGENHLEVAQRKGGDENGDRWTLCLALDGPSKYASADGTCRR
jgi:hypothetical protein